MGVTDHPGATQPTSHRHLVRRSCPDSCGAHVENVGEKRREKRREKMLAGNNPIMLAVDARDRADYVGGSALAADAD